MHPLGLTVVVVWQVGLSTYFAFRFLKAAATARLRARARTISAGRKKKNDDSPIKGAKTEENAIGKRTHTHPTYTYTHIRTHADREEA